MLCPATRKYPVLTVVPMFRQPPSSQKGSAKSQQAESCPQAQGAAENTTTGSSRGGGSRGGGRESLAQGAVREESECRVPVGQQALDEVRATKGPSPKSRPVSSTRLFLCRFRWTSCSLTSLWRNKSPNCQLMPRSREATKGVPESLSLLRQNDVCYPPRQEKHLSRQF